MKCDRCNRPAVVHQVVIEGGAHTEKHLCEVHAAEEGVPNPGKAPINQLLAKVVVPTQTVPSCPDCDITLTEIRRTSLLGCPRCYDTFGEAIEVIIRAAQVEPASMLAEILADIRPQRDSSMNQKNWQKPSIMPS